MIKVKKITINNENNFEVTDGGIETKKFEGIWSNIDGIDRFLAVSKKAKGVTDTDKLAIVPLFKSSIVDVAAAQDKSIYYAITINSATEISHILADTTKINQVQIYYYKFSKDRKQLFIVYRLLTDDAHISIVLKNGKELYSDNASFTMIDTKQTDNKKIPNIEIMRALPYNSLKVIDDAANTTAAVEPMTKGAGTITLKEFTSYRFIWICRNSKMKITLPEASTDTKRLDRARKITKALLKK